MGRSRGSVRSIRGGPAAVSVVLVTGASGFVGLPVIAELAGQGTEVHALSRRSSPPEVPGVRWHRVDLDDDGALERLIADVAPERLVHLAWYVEHGRFWDAPENVLWVERSLRLLRAFARAGGARAVLLGTCAEYDWSAADGPLSESGSPLVPGTLYGVAKDALRRVACAYAAREGFELAWGRPFFFYGPREDPRRLVASVARSLLAGEQVDTTSGSQRRDFLHVRDVAGAVVALLGSEVLGPVNIASGEDVAVAEVIDRIADAIGRPELVGRGALGDRPEPPLLVADVARLRDEVGYRPRFTLAEGLADAVRWWEQQGGSRSGGASPVDPSP
jgi:nucleoside-diphosphate-sugar epimerase